MSREDLLTITLTIGLIIYAWLDLVLWWEGDGRGSRSTFQGSTPSAAMLSMTAWHWQS